MEVEESSSLVVIDPEVITPDPVNVDSDLAEAIVVGGHAGLLTDKSSKTVLKPVKGVRGEREADFYRAVFSDSSNVPRSFFPLFHGVKLPEGVDVPMSNPNDKVQLLILEDLCKDFSHPCIMDLKVGVRTWGPDASQSKIDSQKDKYAPQQVMGFRITGMRVWVPHLQEKVGEETEPADYFATISPAVPAVTKAPIKVGEEETQGEWRFYGRPFGLSFTEDTVVDGLRSFVCFRGKVLKNVLKHFIQQLENIKAWFETQTSWEFFGSSLLFVYEAGGGQLQNGSKDVSSPNEPDINTPSPNGENPTLQSSVADPIIKMIDFAHAWPIQNGSRDEGYLLGVENILDRLKEIMESSQ